MGRKKRRRGKGRGKAGKRPTVNQKKYRMIFLADGRAKKVPREPMIDGMSVDEFIRRNADLIWLHQEELWHLMPTEGDDFIEMPPLTIDLENEPFGPDSEDDEDDPYGDRCVRFGDGDFKDDDSFQFPF